MRPASRCPGKGISNPASGSSSALLLHCTFLLPVGPVASSGPYASQVPLLHWASLLTAPCEPTAPPPSHYGSPGSLRAGPPRSDGALSQPAPRDSKAPASIAMRGPTFREVSTTDITHVKSHIHTVMAEKVACFSCRPFFTFGMLSHVGVLPFPK